jgi:large subunit ribosomal protein L4
MDIKMYNQSGKTEGKITVSDSVFAVSANADLVYQVATSQMSNKRKVLAHAKTRSEVRGGGKKPWKQKGTGRARHGSIRSPIWIGGGVAHGPLSEVNFKKKINAISARKSLATVLSARMKEGRLLIVDALEVATGKTKDAVKAFSTLSKGLTDYTAKNRILLVLPGTTDDTPIRRAVGNLPHVDACRAGDLNTLVALSYPYMVATKDAVAVLEKRFSK